MFRRAILNIVSIGRLSQMEETNRKLESQLRKFSKPSKVLASVCFLLFVSFVTFSSWPTSQPFKALPSNNVIPYIPKPVNELDWLLGPIQELWKNGQLLFSEGQNEYPLAVSPKIYEPILRTETETKYTHRNTGGTPTNQKPYKSRLIPDHTMDYAPPEDLLISLPQHEWPAGVNSTQIHSDFIHFLKNQSVSKELTVSPFNRGNKGRPMMLRFPPSDNPLYIKYLNETSFIFDSLQPQFQQKPQNLFVVTLDHAIWVPSRSTPNQTLSLIFPNHNEYVPSNYLSWTRWDCVVTGYQEFLTPIPSNY